MNEIFSRNILIDKIGLIGQKKLYNSKVLIAGLGGLGSGVIANLTSLGIGTLGLIDFDKIELSNLNRQFIHKYNDIGNLKTTSASNWIKSYNPKIKTYIYNTKLQNDDCYYVIKDYDIIVDCFDSYNSKFLLNKVAIKYNKILVHAGVSEFQGQITTIIPNITPCLNCIFENTNNLDNYNIKGIISPTINITAAIQANEVLKIILDLENTLKGKLLTFNLTNYKLKILNFEKNPNCLTCKSI